MTKKVISTSLLLFVFITFGTIVYQETRAKTASEIDWGKGDVNSVIYFHADKRCTTCNNMEAYTKAVVNSDFAKEVASRSLQWRTLNWQREENKTYVKKFSLLGNAIVVVGVENGQYARHLNLDEIWDYSHDEKEFKEYIRKTLGKFIADNSLGRNAEGAK